MPPLCRLPRQSAFPPSHSPPFPPSHFPHKDGVVAPNARQGKDVGFCADEDGVEPPPLRQLFEFVESHRVLFHFKVIGPLYFKSSGRRRFRSSGRRRFRSSGRRHFKVIKPALFHFKMVVEGQLSFSAIFKVSAPKTCCAAHEEISTESDRRPPTRSSF